MHKDCLYKLYRIDALIQVHPGDRDMDTNVCGLSPIQVFVYGVCCSALNVLLFPARYFMKAKQDRGEYTYTHTHTHTHAHTHTHTCTHTLGCGGWS